MHSEHAEKKTKSSVFSVVKKKFSDKKAMSKLLSLLRSPLSALAGIMVIIGILGYYLTRLGLKLGSKYLLLGLGGILLTVLLIVGIYFLWRLFEKRRGKKMGDELDRQQQAEDQQRQQSKLAVQDIKGRWADAMATLKASKVKIYDLPWFLLIGEPQSGKTTTLRESGLDFPLGKDALTGAGGTVNCDWWFTNDAVIIDTAGRFTMPVDTAPDRREWHAFLKLLGRYRSRCPINGVIVTIPATSLLQDSPDTIRNKSRNIQEKLHELVAVLGIEFPVYIMVSKLDLVYGFAEFCASLSAQERTQAVGWNRRDIASKGFNPEEFNHFFELLHGRLHGWSMRRLRDITPGPEADRVYAFPGEFSRVKDTLREYLGFIFSGDRFHSPLLLRGCYFSSGLQEGRSIARALLSGAKAEDKGIMAEFAKSFVQSRAYFINIFYRKVFREQGLVNRAGKMAKQEITFRIAAGVTATVILVVTAWLLISGYNRLLNLVQPLELHARKAQTMLLGKGQPAQPVDFNEVVTVIDTLDRGRLQLMEQGVRRFFKSKEHGIVRKIGRIEDALLEQMVLHPMLLAAGENFAAMERLADPAEKARFLKLLLLYLDTKAGKAISGNDIMAGFDFVPWQSPAMRAINRIEVERLVKGYPYGDMPNFTFAKFRGTMFQARDGMGRLQEFWATYYPELWKKIQDAITTINASYGNLNVMPMRPGDDNDFASFSAEAKRFLEGIDFLSAIGRDDLVWTAAIKASCQEDYLLLGKALTDQPPGDINSLTSTATRHSQICQDTEQNIGSQWAAFIRQNSHVVHDDGQLDPDMLAVKKAVRVALDFGPLFTPEESKRLQEPGTDPLAVLGFWNQAWQKERETKSGEIQALIAGLQGEKWKKPELQAALDSFMRHIVWLSERDATIAAIKAVSSQDAITADSLSPGLDPPRMARASWLTTQYTTLSNIHESLRQKYPAATVGLKPVHAAMTEVMLESWQRCLQFWHNTIRDVDPAARILSTKSWQAFRQEVMNQQGIFLDISVWPMDAFLDAMPLKDIQGVKEVLWNAVNKALASSSLRSLEQKVEKTAYVYSGNRYMSMLDESQNDFYNAVKELSDDATQSWQALSAKPETGASPMDAFSALRIFANKVERDALSRGEPLALRLAAIESHGISLLKGKVASGVSTSFASFIGEWQKKIGDTFPFGNPERWIIEDNIEGNLRTLTIQVGSAAVLNDFFFSADNGFEVFVKKYGLLQAKPAADSSAAILNEAQKRFLKECQQWREFLFDEGGRPKSHRVEVMIDDAGDQADQAAARFTQLLFNGLEDDKRKALRLRFSGNRYKRGEALWDLHAAPAVTIEAINEETGMKTSLRVTGGSIAFPAYLISSGTRLESTRLSEWRVSLQLPESLIVTPAKDGEPAVVRTQPGFALVPLKVGFDQLLPGPVSWPR